MNYDRHQATRGAGTVCDNDRPYGASGPHPAVAGESTPGQLLGRLAVAAGGRAVYILLFDCPRPSADSGVEAVPARQLQPGTCTSHVGRVVFHASCNVTQTK